jgi:predicted esterase
MISLYGQSKDDNIKELDFDLEEVNSRIKYPDILMNKALFKTYILTFRSSYNTGIDENDNAYAELYINNKSRNHAPLLILIHGLGSKKSSLNNYYYFLEHILKSGLSCMFFNLPYHLKRTPCGEQSGQRPIYFDDIETLRFYHQAVADIRRSLDITSSIFKFSKNIICGFSMGSMVAEITLAVEERFSKGILIFCGGNWFEIHWKSFLSFILKGNCLKDEGGNITRKKCRSFYDKFPEFLEEFKKRKDFADLDFTLSSDPELMKKTVKKCFLCDPLAFASRIEPEKVLMINSRFDHFFPNKSTLQLWDELGNPKIYWFSRLHTSKILRNKKLLRIVLDFIKQ